MAKNPESQPFVKGLYMQAVTSAESAANLLKAEKNLSSAERRWLEELVEQGEHAKGHLREMGVRGL